MNNYEYESALAEALSSGQQRRELIRGLNRALPPGRNRWFHSQNNARRAAHNTARKLTRRTGRPFGVHHHVYEPLGLRHYHLAAPNGRPLRMRFLYGVVETLREGETNQKLGKIVRSVSGKARAVPPRQPISRPARRFSAYGGRQITPADTSRSRPTGYRRPAQAAQRISPADKKRISDTAWKDFERKRASYATKLRVRKGEDVHHAIERQTLTRYPGVFSQAEINDIRNMRGIPMETVPEGKKHATKTLHNRAIRDLWDYHYRKLDATIVQNGLKPGTPAYKEFVRDYLTSARDEIDWAVSQYFTEAKRRVGKPSGSR